MKKRRILLVILPSMILALLIGTVLFGRAPQTTLQTPPSNELPLEQTPPNLLVVPEAPLGTIAILLACFLALIIAQKRPRTKLS